MTETKVVGLFPRTLENVIHEILEPHQTGLYVALVLVLVSTSLNPEMNDGGVRLNATVAAVAAAPWNRADGRVDEGARRVSDYDRPLAHDRGRLPGRQRHDQRLEERRETYVALGPLRCSTLRVYSAGQLIRGMAEVKYRTQYSDLAAFAGAYTLVQVGTPRGVLPSQS